MINLQAVSYTHLDVYKRQVMTYCVSGIFPDDIYSELVNNSNDNVNNVHRDSDKLASRCSVLRARINNY